MAVDEKTKPPRRDSGGDAAKRRLAVMPLAVLLPGVGELNNLTTFRADFGARLEELQGEQGPGADEGDTKRLGEEAMLFQVLQWLNLGESA